VAIGGRRNPQAGARRRGHRIDLALFYDAKLDLNAWQTIGAMMHASSENEPLYDAAVLRALIADALLFRNTPDQVRDWIDGFN
jgi:hypothetical protein